METNGNGELKDIELLLRSDKTVVPKLDSWYVQFIGKQFALYCFCFFRQEFTRHRSVLHFPMPDAFSSQPYHIWQG